MNKIEIPIPSSDKTSSGKVVANPVRTQMEWKIRCTVKGCGFRITRSMNYSNAQAIALSHAGQHQGVQMP